MRPRDEVVLAVVLLTGLFGAAAWIASTGEGATEVSPYPSTFAADPGGARGLFEGLQRLGVGTRRWRQRTTALPAIIDSTRRQLVAVLQPGPLSPLEARALLSVSERTPVFLAGPGASSLMHCFGYRVGGVRAGDAPHGETPTLRELARRDSMQAVRPGHPPDARAPWVQHTLQRHFERLNVDSSRSSDGVRFSCTVPAMGPVDTLLVTTRGEPVLVRVRRAAGGPALLLLADDGLVRNAALRRTGAGETVLGLLATRYDQIIFDEYHHGFRATGSMSDALLAWSRRSPWGWAAWQLILVGVLVLLFRMVRFGAVRPAIARTRRSSLEHVRALATALSSARGADEAIGAIIRGLRRRLSPGARARGDARGWLAEMQAHATTPAQRALFAELQSLAQPGQSADQVRRAALTVEELWQHLRP